MTQTIETELQKQPAEKPLTEWEQIVLKLINGELEIIKEGSHTIQFNDNNKKYEIWIANRNTPSVFGTLYTINDCYVEKMIQDKTQIRPEIQEKLKVCWKLTDDDILQKFEQEYFKL